MTTTAPRKRVRARRIMAFFCSRLESTGLIEDIAELLHPYFLYPTSDPSQAPLLLSGILPSGTSKANVTSKVVVSKDMPMTLSKSGRGKLLVRYSVQKTNSAGFELGI